MSELLDFLYRCRLAIAKCEAGGELDMDEIQLLGAAEQRLSRARVRARALLRGHDLNDWADVHLLGTGGLLCRGCPPAQEGQLLDVVLDDEERRLSYRFKARVTWAAFTEEEGIELQLTFEGAPLLVRKNPLGERVPDVVAAFAA